jgi:hypothetical protein
MVRARHLPPSGIEVVREASMESDHKLEPQERSKRREKNKARKSKIHKRRKHGRS